MAVWLWVSDLDPKNEWLELLSLSWGAGSSGWGSGGSARGGSLKDIHINLKPGRFAARFYSWAVRGDAKTVYVFYDPQTEYQLSGAMATSLSTNAQGFHSISINFESMKLEHSGAP